MVYFSDDFNGSNCFTKKIKIFIKNHEVNENKKLFLNFLLDYSCKINNFKFSFYTLASRIKIQNFTIFINTRDIFTLDIMITFL